MTMVRAAVIQAHANMPKDEAIWEAGHKRAQPIVMTTVAMVAGMIPTALSLSGDSSWRAPMGVVVIGAGQAGLAIGYHLAKQGRDFTILEAAADSPYTRLPMYVITDVSRRKPAATSTWRSRWRSRRRMSSWHRRRVGITRGRS